MIDPQRILSARQPLTQSGTPTGFLPVVLADLARASAGNGARHGKPARTVFIAPDEQAMQAIADTAPWFAPELEIVSIPAWDCLPYDRASPSLRSAAQRLAGLYGVQGPVKAPQLVLTTAAAITQRTLTPFRVRQLVARLAPGERIDINRLIAILQANGYVRTDTEHDAGEFAVRGGIVDLYPGGAPEPMRLDFFGDEIETLRSFDPGTQRSTGDVKSFTLLPASEALLDEDTIKRFRTRYRDLFGATATGDPLYQAVSDGRRLAGMEHWLPLFEERLVPLLDHLGEDALILRDGGVTGAAQTRFEAITDYHANRVASRGSDPGSYRPLGVDQLYLTADEWAGPRLRARTDAGREHL